MGSEERRQGEREVGKKGRMGKGCERWKRAKMTRRVRRWRQSGGRREKLGAQLVSVALIPRFEWYK